MFLSQVLTPEGERVSWGFLSFDRSYDPAGKENNLEVEKIGTYNEKATRIHCSKISGSHVSWVFRRRRKRRNSSGCLQAGSSPVSTPDVQGENGWRCKNVTGKRERFFFLIWDSIRL